LQTGRHTDRKSVYTSRVSSVGSQESNMFDSCDPIDDRFENSEFGCLHMTIGLQTGRRTVFAYRFAYRSSCVNALLAVEVTRSTVSLCSPTVDDIGDYELRIEGQRTFLFGKQVLYRSRLFYDAK